MPILYLLLAMLLFAWSRVEHKHGTATRGEGSLVLGSLLLGFGIAVFLRVEPLFAALVIAAGFYVSFRGLARLIVALRS